MTNNDVQDSCGSGLLLEHAQILPHWLYLSACVRLCSERLVRSLPLGMTVTSVTSVCQPWPYNKTKHKDYTPSPRNWQIYACIVEFRFGRVQFNHSIDDIMKNWCFFCWPNMWVLNTMRNRSRQKGDMNGLSNGSIKLDPVGGNVGFIIKFILQLWKKAQKEYKSKKIHRPKVKQTTQWKKDI